jgi:hypothetical protein
MTYPEERTSSSPRGHQVTPKQTLYLLLSWRPGGVAGQDGCTDGELRALGRYARQGQAANTTRHPETGL